MNAASPVRYGIVSPAKWGRKLLEAARGSPWLAFHGVASRAEANAREICTIYGGVIYPSYAAMLADPAIEAVLLPTPHFLHCEQTLQALQAGKHVFVEKPMATSVSEAVAMQQAARRAQRVLAVGQQGRRTGAARKAKALLDAGRIGTLVHAVAVQGFPSAFRWENGHWRHDSRHMPGGPLDELGVHYFDLMRYLAGPIARVMGWTAYRHTSGEGPDAATAVFQFASGAIGSYTTHLVSVGVSQLALYGTKGALHLNRFGQELLLQPLVDTETAKQSGTGFEPVPFDGPHPFSTALTEQLEDFARCVREGGEPEVGAREGIAALRVSRAVLESAETGRAVDLPED